jgi:hypothetical protein
MAATEGRLEILHKVWEWADKKLTAEEINNTLLKPQIIREKFSFIWQQHKAR